VLNAVVLSDDLLTCITIKKPYIYSKIIEFCYYSGIFIAIGKIVNHPLFSAIFVLILIN